MQQKDNPTVTVRKRWPFFVVTLLLIPLVVQIVSITYEACIENRLSICVRTVPTPVISVVPWTPTGRELVFNSIRDGDQEIYVMRDDGSDLVALTNNPASDVDPSWSPDGLHIVFTSDRDGDEEIYVMNADGSAVQQVTFNDAFDCCADWSPDGSKLAFNSNLPDGDQDIYVIGVDGHGLTNLTDSSGDDRNPAWSPDGTNIAFDSRRDGQAEIYVMNADGTNQVRLTYLFSAERGPAWSPNGSLIAYDSNQVDGQPAAEGDHDIFLMNSDGSNQVRIVRKPGEDRWPTWYPNGQYIVFTSFVSGDSNSGNVYTTLWTGGQLSVLIGQAAGGAHWKPVP